MDFRILLLVILLNASGCLGEGVNVSCSPQTICALQESTVELKCFYSNLNMKAVFWFSPKQKTKWRNEEDPEDLALDSDYAGRVNYTETTRSSSAITIRDVRERDSGEYHLMIITEEGGKYISLTAVNLTVTGLEVKLKDRNTLLCSTSCTLTSVQQQYIWYKNGQYTETTMNNNLVLSTNEDSYSCSVSKHQKTRSSPLCVSDKNCWSVTPTDRRVCVLEGSSVDFPCSYSFPSGHTVTEVFWHYLWRNSDPKSLAAEHQFVNRVDYIGDQKENCTLRMTNVRQNDAGDYYFRITTNYGRFSGNPGVILNVTDLQVKVSSSMASDGQTITLTCSTSCTLPINTTYIWYKNTQPVTDKPTRDNKLYLKCSEDVDNYSCAVRGQNNLSSPAQTISEKCPEAPSEIWMLVGAVGLSVVLVLILAAAALWMWRRKSRPTKHQQNTRLSVQDHTWMGQSDKKDFQCQDEVHYSSICFQNSCTQEGSTSPRHPRGNMEGEHVQYAVVNFNR